MQYRIVLSGGNGAGKSTLGKALAVALNLPFLDIEDYYFPKTDPGYLFATQRTQTEAVALLLADVKRLEGFVLAAVKADYTPELSGTFTHAVLVDVPKNIRMQRVRQRSFGKFGGRMLPGGDLWEQEERFFAMVENRSDDRFLRWLGGLAIPVFRADGLLPVEQNVQSLCRQLADSAL
jgi:adenylate kinase family enzyme